MLSTNCTQRPIMSTGKLPIERGTFSHFRSVPVLPPMPTQFHAVTSQWQPLGKCIYDVMRCVCMNVCFAYQVCAHGLLLCLLYCISIYRQYASGGRGTKVASVGY